MKVGYVELDPRTDGNPVTDTSSLEALEWAVLATRAKREELEETLRVLPRWRLCAAGRSSARSADGKCAKGIFTRR
jgi:hypothetical protein